MTVATYVQPDKVAQNAQPSQYAADIDAATAVLAEIGANFAPHEAATPDMTVVVDAGKIQIGKNTLNVAQQTTPAFTAPTTDPRIDLILIDTIDGSLVVIAGAESAAPVPPAITSTRYVLVAEVLLQTSTTAIDNSIITDRRPLLLLPPRLERDVFDMPVDADNLLINVPAGTRIIELLIDKIAIGSPGIHGIELGSNNVVETSGYSCLHAELRDSVSPFVSTSSARIDVSGGLGSGEELSGTVLLYDFDGTGRYWLVSAQTRSSGQRMMHTSATKLLNAEIDSLRIKNYSGVNYAGGRVAMRALQ